MLALVHALAEVLACIVFYATTGTNVENMFYVLFVLVGFGTIIHSMVDYTLALAVYKVIRKRRLKRKNYDKRSPNKPCSTLERNS